MKQWLTMLLLYRFDFYFDGQVKRYICLDKSLQNVYESLILVDN